MEKRESFKSRLGFLLVSAGCAIGIGNVWKFPYVAGQNGGGVFVLFYLLFLVIMGVPVLTMELAVGRASRKGAVGGYRELEPKKSFWHLHGWACLIGCYLLMMYYTTVAGWMLDYFTKFAIGKFNTVTDAAGTAEVFGNMLANPWEMLLFMGIVVAFGFFVCSFPLRGGLERVTKIMMIGLLVLIGVLVVNSILLDGGLEGLKFYLVPDFKRAAEVGIFKVIVAGMNQAFFTLSLGIAAMEIFGSYMSKKTTIGSEAIKICSLDTMVAIASGLIIFPACFAFGITPDSGPSLIFITLPNVFINMPLGRVWGTLFFLFMTFASFSTVTAVFQNIIASCRENFKWSKKKAVLINFAIIFGGSIPTVLGYNVLKSFLIGGKDILDFEDFIVSSILLPLGSLIFLLFSVSKNGWGFKKYLEECNTGRGFKMKKWMLPYLKYVLPILIIVIFITGIISA